MIQIGYHGVSLKCFFFYASLASNQHMQMSNYQRSLKYVNAVTHMQIGIVREVGFIGWWSTLLNGNWIQVVFKEYKNPHQILFCTCCTTETKNMWGALHCTHMQTMKKMNEWTISASSPSSSRRRSVFVVPFFQRNHGDIFLVSFYSLLSQLFIVLSDNREEKKSRGFVRIHLLPPKHLNKLQFAFWKNRIQRNSLMNGANKLIFKMTYWKVKCVHVWVLNTQKET